MSPRGLLLSSRPGMRFPVRLDSWVEIVLHMGQWFVVLHGEQRRYFVPFEVTRLEDGGWTFSFLNDSSSLQRALVVHETPNGGLLIYPQPLRCRFESADGVEGTILVCGDPWIAVTQTLIRGISEYMPACPESFRLRLEDGGRDEAGNRRADRLVGYRPAERPRS